MPVFFSVFVVFLALLVFRVSVVVGKGARVSDDDEGNNLSIDLYQYSVTLKSYRSIDLIFSNLNHLI